MVSLDDVKRLSQGYKIFPVSKEILSDITTPMQVLRILKGTLILTGCLFLLKNAGIWNIMEVGSMISVWR